LLFSVKKGTIIYIFEITFLVSQKMVLKGSVTAPNILKRREHNLLFSLLIILFTEIYLVVIDCRL
jgi:hypothetical protein